MSLRMSKQAIIELLNSNAVKYRKTLSRKAKSVLLSQPMELTGYKSSKSIIRYYSRMRKRKRVEKRGRLTKLTPNDIEVIKTIWLKSDHRRFHEEIPEKAKMIKATGMHKEVDADHGRQEERICRVYRELSLISASWNWPKLSALVEVERRSF